ncbi:hypothetical protein [Embleya hyalina]|uniref:Toxin RelE n=1 Tax=Embleya hyalina TaxID=516124 RepID=A0A401YTP0_9ACTN|nr:hypothetical protein [Embleya hyalina]GCD97964.1 hypothetical protein EHYA_05664 [Embleya hyalina]
MSYLVVYDAPAARQKAGLPQPAVAALNDLESALERDPWSVGGRMHSGLKTMREVAFGAFGFITFVIEDNRVRVSVMNVVWTG